VVVFQRHILDAIQYTSFPKPLYVNLNAQRDHGLENEPTVQLGKKLTVRAFYAYVTGAHTTRTEGGTDTTYYNLIRRPATALASTPATA
jgi:hypothetical protein